MKPETGNWSILTHDRQHGLISGIAWAPDGTLIYYDRVTDVPQGIFSVPVLDGEEHLVLESARYPEPLPDGTLLVFRLNPERKLQLFRFWPDTGRLQGFPVILMVGIELNNYIRALPDGRKAMCTAHPSGKNMKAAAC